MTSPPTHIPTYSDTSRPTFRPSISPSSSSSSSSYPTSSQPTIFPTQHIILKESNFPTNYFLQESEFPTLQPSISPSNNIDTKQEKEEKEVSQNIPSSFPTLAQYTIFIYNNDDENNSPTIEPEMFNMPISLKFTESNSLLPTQQDNDESQFPFVQIVPVIIVAILFFIFFKHRPRGVAPEDDVIHEDEI